MVEELKEIDEIVFGIYSADEIRKMSVCKVDNPRLCNNDKTGSYGTVYDPRLGTIENGVICVTCNQNLWLCPGHWGYIELNENVIHPLYYKQVVSFLRCFCTKCYKLLITEDQIKINNLNRLKGVKRFNKILERLEKIDMCTHCSHPQPSIKHTISDNTISMIYKDKDKRKVSITLQVDEIKKIFDNISVKDVELLGFDPKLNQPKNLILSVFPVIPVSCRPFVLSDANMCDDDLTIQLVEIIKANNHLEQVDGQPISETKKQKYLQSLKFRISTFYNNSCLAPETPVLMWTGFSKRADEIEIGDELIGDDGEKRTVQMVCSGEDEMYNIIQQSGDDYTVNSNHYLTLIYEHHKKIFWYEPCEEHPLGYWLITWWDSDEYQIYLSEHTVVDDKIDTLKEICFYRKRLLCPYIFDIKVKDYLNLPDIAKNYLVGVKLNMPTEWETKNIPSIDPNDIGPMINANELDKIPDEFIYNDKYIRRAALDSVVKNCSNKIDIEIKKQVLYLCRSLGLNFTNDDDYICSRIEVKSVGKGKYNGFIIDKNHRFLLGDFTITHNSGKAKHSTNNRPIKGIKERLTGKEGLIRSNLSGKRCEMTARTVIGPDPTLKMGQICVPPQIATNLTYPIPVNNFNYDFLTQLVNEGKINYVLKDNGKTRINLENALYFKGTRLNHGDIIVRKDKDGKDVEMLLTNGKDLLMKGDRLKRNGEWVKDIKYPEKRTYKLNIGDICERQMYDGAIVLLNRQPTLHEGSMMAQEVVIRPGKTIRFNLAINKAFNADFDSVKIPSKTREIKSL